ncbi:MAG: TPM domain-containing protein [Gemmatimonadota bacterium]
MWGLLALVASLLAAQEVQLPSPPRGFSPTQADMVVDRANVLSADAVARINRVIFDVKAKSGGEIVVVTLPDLAGRDVGDVALRIGREWKVGAAADIGQRSRNAGVVVLVVPKETSSDGRGYISIQTGQGTEGFITDATAGNIRREAVPYFQQRDYSTALELITVRVAQRFEREFGFTLDTSIVPAPVQGMGGRGEGIPPQLLLVAFVVLLFIFSAMANASRRGRRDGCLQALLVADAISHSRGRSHWGGGGFGGGSWGGGGGGGFGGFGGGGGFSGGGSSGSW